MVALTKIASSWSLRLLEIARCYDKDMLQKLIAVSMAVVTLAMIAIMQLTTPATIHPIGLLVFFLCLYTLILGGVTYLLYVGHRLWARLSRRHQPLTLWRSYQFSSIVALAPVMLIAMRTVSTVTLVDVLFVGIFIVVAIFYVMKRG